MVVTEITPPNSLVLLTDGRDGGAPPMSMNGQLVAGTSSCIAIGCHAEVDGPTELVLGRILEVDPGYEPVFEGVLDAPSGQLVVNSVNGDIYARLPLLRTFKAQVTVWADQPHDPKRVIIGVEDA
jgi:hypothetical protein